MNRRHLLAALASLPLAARATAMQSAAFAAPVTDMAVLRAALGIHPGLHRYSSPRQIATRLDTLEAAWTAAPDVETRYLLLSRFLATIRCGHSYCNFFNQSDALATALYDRPTRVPFHFVWIDGAMVVTADHSGTGRLSPGTRVTHVNSLPARDMLARLMPFARADGHNDAKRRSLLGVGGGDSIEYFDVFQGLLLPPRDGAHDLRIVAADGRATSLTVPAMTLAQRRATMTPAITDGNQPLWQWTMRPDGIALLTMPGWAMYNSRWDWRGWLDERLDILAGARGLVIDIRSNEGGEDCGDLILERLITRDFAGVSVERRLRFTTLPDALAPYASTWDDSFRTLGVGGRPLGNGFIEQPATSSPTPLRPSARRITVPVAALIGPTNSSATFGFAEAARATGTIRLFGETTGGNRRGINGGAFFFVTLPESRIEFDLPLIGIYPRTPQPDAGIEPDVHVPLRWQDVAIGRDAPMEAAVAWIAGRA